MDDFFAVRAFIGLIVLLGFAIRYGCLALQEKEEERKAKTIRELIQAFDEETRRGGFNDPQRLDHLAEREGYGDR